MKCQSVFQKEKKSQTSVIKCDEIKIKYKLIKRDKMNSSSL